MFSLKNLIILTCFLSSFYAHECLHDKQNFTFKAVEDPHPSKFLKYSASDYRPINITFDYSNLGHFPFDARIIDTLLPPVKSLLEASLKVIPRTSKILVPSDMIGMGLKVPVNGSTEGYDGDIVIFVSLVSDHQSPFVARSWPCGYDSKTHRPIVGGLQFNNALMNPDISFYARYETLVSTALHEITHILGFSQFLYPYFINPETFQPLTGHFFKKTVNEVETMVLDLPPLTKRLRAHFNCPTLEGAYLENQGGSGSAGSHFERRVFYNEYMTASSIRDKRFSEFSLAVLEGSGWYQVNYSYAEPMTYGKNQGCAFLDTKCVNSTTLKPNFKEFCSPLTSKGVSWTRREIGYCGSNTSQASPLLKPEFDYWGNQTIVNDGFADNCPQIQTSLEYIDDIFPSDYPKIVEYLDCEDTDRVDHARLDIFSEFHGYGAKAFMGTLSTNGAPYSSYDGYCFRTKCAKKKNGNYNLQVFVSVFADPVNCTAAGDIDASSFGNLGLERMGTNLTGVLQCPDPNEFCEQVETEGNCRGNCFANGVCVEKECKCYDGWTSYNCAHQVEVKNSSRCTEDSLRTTAYGNQCICSYENITCQCLLGEINDKRCPNYKPDVIPDVIPDVDDANKGGLGRFLIPALVVLALVCVAGWLLAKRKKQASAMEASISRPILPKNPKQSTTTL